MSFDDFQRNQLSQDIRQRRGLELSASIAIVPSRWVVLAKLNEFHDVVEMLWTHRWTIRPKTDHVSKWRLELPFC
jgi:hypothetical protein